MRKIPIPRGKKNGFGVFPGGLVVKNLPCSTADVGSTPGQRTRVPHAAEQLSPSTTATESMCCTPCPTCCIGPQLRPNTAAKLVN